MRYGVTEGVLVVDDSDKKRARQTRRIYNAYKLKEKKKRRVYQRAKPCAYSACHPDRDDSCWGRVLHAGSGVDGVEC